MLTLLLSLAGTGFRTVPGHSPQLRHFDKTFFRKRLPTAQNFYTYQVLNSGRERENLRTKDTMNNNIANPALQKVAHTPIVSVFSVVNPPE